MKNPTNTTERVGKLSLPQAAKYVKLPVEVFRVRRFEPDHYDMGKGKLFYDPADLDRWIGGKKVKGQRIEVD